MAAAEHLTAQARLQETGTLRVAVSGGHQLHVARLRRRGAEPRAALVLLADLACDHRMALGAGAIGGELALAGFEVYAADLRGHGGSWPRIGSQFEGDFAALIEVDLPALAARIQRDCEGLPLYWLAPGWAALWLLAAARAGGLGRADGLALWRPGPPPGHWHRALWPRLARPLAAVAGYLPARPWRLGQVDEAAGLVRDAAHWLRQPRPAAAFIAARPEPAQALPPCLYLGDLRTRWRGEEAALLRALGPHDARLLWLQRGGGPAEVAAALRDWVAC